MIWEWVPAYGLPGRPAPLVRSDLLIGGVKHGQRIITPVSNRVVVVPAPTRPPLLHESARGDHGTPRGGLQTVFYYPIRFQPCWDAEQMEVLVAQGLDQRPQDAKVLYKELMPHG